VKRVIDHKIACPPFVCISCSLSVVLALLIPRVMYAVQVQQKSGVVSKAWTSSDRVVVNACQGAPVERAVKSA
jgi:hypothetical protein